MSTLLPSEETPKWRPAALSLTVFGALARMLPHPPNFAPVGAASVFAGARLPRWQAYLVPLAIMAVTDPIINAAYGLRPFAAGRLWIYFSFLVSVWIGRRLRRTENVGLIAGAMFVNAVQFFAISNFATWLGGTLYAHTPAGLAACYIAAVPFFGWTLLSDLSYAALFFGLHAWLSRGIAASERVPSRADWQPATH
jgi:hypothetical protein